MTPILVSIPIAQLFFKSRFPKGGPTCRRQVVNPWHQAPQTNYSWWRIRDQIFNKWNRVINDLHKIISYFCALWICVIFCHFINKCIVSFYRVFLFELYMFYVRITIKDIYIYNFIWRRNQNMSPCTGNGVNTNYERWMPVSNCFPHDFTV